MTPRAFAPLRASVILRSLGWALAAMVALAPVSAAEEGARIVEVTVKGAQTVAPETILAKVQTKPGARYQDAAVSEDIRRLFALGYFTDVRADVEETPEGLRLVFLVQEKPTVQAVEVQGNRALPKKKALELFGLATGELHDPRKIKEGIDQIKAEYARKGFAQAEVASKTDVNQTANTATVYLAIDEGARTRISGILVEGNQAFSDKRVRKVLKTKPRRWVLFSGIFSEQVLEEDLERVRAFYRKNGYQDVQVSREVYRNPSGKGLLVHLKVDEGLQHRVGAIAIDGAVLFPERELRQVLSLKPGAVYNDQALQEDLRAIKQYYGDRGYIHAEIAPDPQLDQATKRVNLTYHITEHDLVYVNRIDVEGNLRTKDIVVRRELRIYPGQAFHGASIRKSIDRLYNLGYFEEVTVDTHPVAHAGAPVANKEDLVVQVKEAKTGSFSFGGGFSSVDRLVGMVEVEQRNFDWRNWPHFTGAGQDLRARVEVGTVRRYYDISFTEPWIFGRPLSLGLDGYNRTRLRSRDLGLAFQEERRGAGIRLGKEFADILRVGLDYQLFRIAISDVVDEASVDLRAEQGRNIVSVLGMDTAVDTRDNRIDPTKGRYVFLSGDMAGGIIGGDKDFFRVQTGASQYLSHFSRYVLELRARTGVVRAFGDSNEVPIFERFFGGGSGTIRGFRERRVGPRDPNSNDPIGGEATFLGTVEEVATLIKDERNRPILKGSVFLDVGDVWRRTGDYWESFKVGTGIGARVNTPIGPVRLDLGFPVSTLDPGEKRTPRFHFNISRSF